MTPVAHLGITILAASTLLAAGACAGAPESSPAQTPAAVTAPADGEETAAIEQLEREWVAAIVKKDVTAIDRLLAAGFVGTSPTAHTYGKDVALADLKSGLYAVKSMNLDEVSANVYGNTAIAFTSQQEESTYGGEDTSGHYHFTNVWIRDNGQWRVIASHGSRYGQRH
jgi:ketosteroid isomerase-like protein